jgi:hypothetical protein
MIRDLQAELHAKVGEANAAIRGLQAEHRSRDGECYRGLRDSWAQWRAWMVDYAPISRTVFRRVVNVYRALPRKRRPPGSGAGGDVRR